MASSLFRLYYSRPVFCIRKKNQHFFGRTLAKGWMIMDFSVRGGGDRGFFFCEGGSTNFRTTPFSSKNTFQPSTSFLMVQSGPFSNLTFVSSTRICLSFIFPTQLEFYCRIYVCMTQTTNHRNDCTGLILLARKSGFSLAMKMIYD